MKMYILVATFVIVLFSLGYAYSISGYVYYIVGDTYATSAKLGLYKDQACDSDSLITTTCINANHYYIFHELENGTYYVKVIDAINWPSGRVKYYSNCESVTISGASETKDITADNNSYCICLMAEPCTGCPNYE